MEGLTPGGSGTLLPDADMPDAGRKRRLDVSVAKGVAWTAGAKWVTQLVSWAALLITARRLNQSDYGIGEMAGFFFALTNSMAEFGVGTAALHLTELDDEKLHQLHGFSLLLCTVIYGVSLLASPFIAQFFHRPDLVIVIAVTNLTFFITGFQAVPTGLLQRDMDYRRLSIAEAALYLTQSVVTVAAALAGWGFWALVLGPVTGKLVNAALVLWWKPVGFSFPKWKEIRPALQFGGQTSMGNMAVTAYLHSDVIVVGRVLGDAALGSYRMAAYLASAPAEKIAMLVMRTAGPLFANLQDDSALVRRYFLLLLDTLNLFVVPAMVGLVMVAPEATEVLLGPKWVESAKPLVWLSMYMVVYTMNSLVTQVLTSQRQTKFTMWISFVNLALMPIAFYLGARWGGIAGVAAAWVVTSPLTFLPSAIYLLRRIELRWWEYISTLLPTIISAASMSLALYGLRLLLLSYGLAPGWNLAIKVILGGTVYAAVLLIFFREKLSRYLRFLKSLRGGKATAPQDTLAEIPLS